MNRSADWTPWPLVSGGAIVTPALDAAQREHWSRVAITRHADAAYSVPQPGPRGPSIWCPFRPNADGSAFVWTGVEKGREFAGWMRHIVEGLPGHSVEGEFVIIRPTCEPDGLRSEIVTVGPEGVREGVLSWRWTCADCTPADAVPAPHESLSHVCGGCGASVLLQPHVMPWA